MKRIFITGDRSQNPMSAAEIVNLIISKVLTDEPEGVRFSTGNMPSGIERAVRYLVPEQFLDVVSYGQDDEGHVDFGATLSIVATEIDTAIVIHTDPLNSRLSKAVTQHFSNVEFPLDAILNKAPDDISSLLNEEAPKENPEN